MTEEVSGVITQKIVDVSKQRRNLLLLDRDGTLNYDKGHTYKVEDLSVIEKNVKQLANLIDQETAIYCISNQSGIGRGFYTYEQAMIFNSALADQLRLFDIHVEKFIMCPHTMEAQCLCRKPKTLMIELAIKDTSIKNSHCTFIGNTFTDQQASAAMNISYLDVNSDKFIENVLKRKNELNVDN